ncbi:conserved phage C-terminal domain-containing protein [Winslowiella arboricola]|uniref:conserved phage C-terminal domain-containing protein n=1 Tax=Winslowiella arboricola TaxID=2978220 RepID=UPI00225E3B9B|nr:conserved phage C-terminal domain-containing protein [Winslowiella arboricola]MCU5775202.1 conserved phage C-terminal domain-containing protein [Winslowiella arboricola]
MSVKLSAYVWDGCAAAGIKGTQLLVLARMADFSSDEGICWPGIETIARQIGAGRSTVITAITQLQKAGWLKRQERRQGNRNKTNVYTLNVAKLRKAAAEYYVDSSAPEHSDSEHSNPERSNSEYSDSERTENEEKRGFDRPESGGDPSVNSTPDPSGNKTPCQPAAQTDPEVAITDSAKRVLNHLNQSTGTRYQVCKTSLGPIRGRLSEGFTESELVVTVDYMSAKWSGDLDMEKYLRPTTLFQPAKFPGYLKSAGSWEKAGRPARVNGKWAKPESDGFKSSYSGVDYQIPEGFRS